MPGRLITFGALRKTKRPLQYAGVVRA